MTSRGMDTEREYIRNMFVGSVDRYREMCRQLLEADRSIDPESGDDTTLERVKYLVNLYAEDPAPRLTPTAAPEGEMPPLVTTDEDRAKLTAEMPILGKSYHAMRLFLALMCRERQLRASQARVAELEREKAELRKSAVMLYSALSNLHAMVAGEYPSLLEDDINGENAAFAISSWEEKEELLFRNPPPEPSR